MTTIDLTSIIRTSSFAESHVYVKEFHLFNTNYDIAEFYIAIKNFVKCIKINVNV